MILNKIKLHFWNISNREIKYKDMQDDLKDIWLDWSLDLTKRKQELSYDDFYMYMLKTGAKMFGLERCEECEENLETSKY